MTEGTIEYVFKIFETADEFSTVEYYAVAFEHPEYGYAMSVGGLTIF